MPVRLDTGIKVTHNLIPVRPKQSLKQKVPGTLLRETGDSALLFQTRPFSSCNRDRGDSILNSGARRRKRTNAKRYLLALRNIAMIADTECQKRKFEGLMNGDYG